MRLVPGKFIPRSRRARVCCGGAVLLAFLGLFFIPTIAGRIVRAQLASLVSDQLNAELKIGSFEYHAPYGITVRDASLVAAGPGGQPVELLSFKQLDLTLARSPFSSGPLLIKELLIQDPSIHLIKTADGIVGEKLLIKSPDGPEPPKRKLSEIFELKRISIARGQVVYENRTKAGAVPLVWRGLQLDVNTQPKAPAVYAFQVLAGAAPVAKLDTSGEMNIDELLLNVAKCTIDATLKPDTPESPLPGELQQRLREYAIDGKLHFTTAGSVPLRALERAAFEGTLGLADAKARVPNVAGADVKQLALNLAFKTTPGDVPALNVEMKSFNADTGQVALAFKNGTISLAGERWKIKQLEGDATFAPNTQFGEFKPNGAIQFSASADGSGSKVEKHDVQLRAENLTLGLPAFPQPLEHIVGTVRAADGKITIDPITATYGSDQIRIDRVTVPLDYSDHRIRIQDIAGKVDFGPVPSKYPEAIADVFAALAPIGEFAVSGSVDVDQSKPEGKVDYKLTVGCTQGALAPPALKAITLFPKFSAMITPAAVNVTSIELPVFNGKIAGGLDLTLGERATYEGNFSLASVELAEAKFLWTDDTEPESELRGKTSGKVRIAGEIPSGDKSAVDALRLDGTIRVVDGYFYQVPVLRQISDWLKVRGGSVVGEAAATFAVQNRVVQLKRAVVSAPVLAAQGKGEIGFDGKLNLVVTAAAPGQQHGGNKIVNGIIGAVNQGLASVGQWGFLEFRVTGDKDKPKLSPAAPAVGQTIDTVVGGIRDFAKNANKR